MPPTNTDVSPTTAHVAEPGPKKPGSPRYSRVRARAYGPWENRSPVAADTCLRSAATSDEDIRDGLPDQRSQSAYAMMAAPRRSSRSVGLRPSSWPRTSSVCWPRLGAPLWWLPVSSR